MHRTSLQPVRFMCTITTRDQQNTLTRHISSELRVKMIKKVLIEMKICLLYKYNERLNKRCGRLDIVSYLCIRIPPLSYTSSQTTSLEGNVNTLKLSSSEACVAQLDCFVNYLQKSTEMGIKGTNLF